MKLQCPICGESSDAAHYPAEPGRAGTPRYCWECLSHGRGRVEVLEVIFISARPKLNKTEPVEPVEPTETPTTTSKKAKTKAS